MEKLPGYLKTSQVTCIGNVNVYRKLSPQDLLMSECNYVLYAEYQKSY